MKVAKILFPCVAWDRSVSWDRNESTTKVLFPEQTARVLGAGIVGPNASDLFAEASRKASNSPPRCSGGTITDLVLPNRES